MATSTAPDYTGVSIKVDAAPGGTPAGSPSVIGHLNEFNPIIGKSRNVTKYTPINENDFSEIVGTGAITYEQFSAQVLYDPSASEGVNKIESAIDSNEQVQIIIELADSKGTNGTIYTQLCLITGFAVSGETDGKLMADITAERIGAPSITAAA